MRNTTGRAVLDYLGTLTVTQGRMAGQPFPVFPWQRRFIRGAFAPDVIEMALSVARPKPLKAVASWDTRAWETPAAPTVAPIAA